MVLKAIRFASLPLVTTGGMLLTFVAVLLFEIGLLDADEFEDEPPVVTG